MAQMALYQKGIVMYGDYTPSSNVNAGDVVASGDTLLICTGGSKVNGGGTGISANVQGAMAVRGGFFMCAGVAGLAVRQKVYWDAVNSRVTNVRGANKKFGYLGDVATVNLGDVVPVEFSPGDGDEAVSAITPTGTGASYADAAPLADGFNVVTGANATLGVALPQPTAGRRVSVKNYTNAVLKVWPNNGTGVINALAAGVNLAMAGLASCTFESDGTVWYSNPTVPS